MSASARHDLIWAAALAAGTAAFVLLVIAPQFGRAHELEEALRSEQALLSRGRADLEALPRLQAQVNHLRRQVSGYDEQVPPRDELGPYLQKLSTAAHQHDLRPDAIEPGALQHIGELTAVPIVIRVHGPFKAVYAWLRDIEELPRLTQIERFDAKVVAERPGEVQTQVQLKVFYRAPGA